MRTIQKFIAALAAVAVLGVASVKPASADGAASTRNIILGSAALIAGIAISNNVAHKNAQATTIAGYTPNGSAVYADGHVVTPNGQSYYPGDYGGQTACSNGQCTVNGNGNGYNNGYSYNGYNGNGYARYGYAHARSNR